LKRNKTGVKQLDLSAWSELSKIRRQSPPFHQARVFQNDMDDDPQNDLKQNKVL
jgi:hypothetical protein